MSMKKGQSSQCRIIIILMNVQLNQQNLRFRKRLRNRLIKRNLNKKWKKMKRMIKMKKMMKLKIIIMMMRDGNKSSRNLQVILLMKFLLQRIQTKLSRKCLMSS